jgi:hypothetical protein
MMNQRWRQGRDSYRPAGEVIRTSDYDVQEIPDDTTAKEFVERHHYSGCFVAARRRFGLYRGDELAGVAVFSNPCSPLVLTNVFPGDWRASMELGRFVLLDDVAGNGESWMLARCLDILRRDGFVGVVSFSDPVARSTADGSRIFPGHVGTIYQASNARFVGLGKARTLRLLPDGTVFSDRAMSKIRKQERGWDHCVRKLEAHGAPKLGGADPRLWLRQAVAAVTRPLRHGGNYKYAFPLDRAVRKRFPASLPYPKRTA